MATFESNLQTSSELNDVISKTVIHVMKESSELTNDLSNSKKRRKPNENEVRRPMNAFMVYAQIARKKVAGKYPNLSYRKLSKTLGELWRMLGDEERKPFVEEAERLRREHKQAHPTYKFKPMRKKKQGNASQFTVFPSNEPPNEHFNHLQPSQERYSITNEDNALTTGHLFNQPFNHAGSLVNHCTVSNNWPFPPQNFHHVTPVVQNGTQNFPFNVRKDDSAYACSQDGKSPYMKFLDAQHSTSAITQRKYSQSNETFAQETSNELNSSLFRYNFPASFPLESGIMYSEQYFPSRNNCSFSFSQPSSAHHTSQPHDIAYNRDFLNSSNYRTSEDHCIEPISDIIKQI